MRRLFLWLIRPFLRWIVRGRPIAIKDEAGLVSVEGRMIGLRIAPGEPPEVEIMPLGSDIHGRRTFQVYGPLRWDFETKRFELEARHALERKSGPRPDSNVEVGDHYPRDRQAPGETPEHGQGPSEEPGPAASAHRRPHGESEGRVGPGHDADSSSEGEARKADGPVADSVADPARHQGAMIRLGVNPDIPPGVLVGVSPDQHLHIHQVNTYSGGLPDGSIIWGNPHTISWIRGNVPNHELH